MKKLKNNCDTGGCNCKSNAATNGSIYCLGFIGAVIYFISTATSFWMGLVGIIKAIFWPAFLVFEFLKYFKV